MIKHGDNEGSVKVFEDIYTTNKWGDRDSKSGTGSNLIQTQEVRRLLPTLIKEFGIRTVLDIPCGDFYWMKEIRNELSEHIDSYIGADIVDELILTNAKNFSSSKFSFRTLNLINSTLPKVDLIFSRDCLVHLSYENIYDSFRNMQKSGSRYLLTTTFTSPKRVNRNIQTGSWRPINFRNFPFFFREPRRLIVENCTENEGSYSDKSLMLCEIDSIKTYMLWIEIRRQYFLASIKKLMRKLL